MIYVLSISGGKDSTALWLWARRTALGPLRVQVAQDTGWEFDGTPEIPFVRIICGDFARVLTPAVTTSHGLTGVILDPPYTPAERCNRLYEVEDGGAAARAAAWARENGENPLLRIVLCGYAGEHDMPASWRCIPWRAHGGYGLQAHGRGRENRDRERLWLSPHCVCYDAPQQLELGAST